MLNKFDYAHMRSARNYADLSTARRLKVGCVIVKDSTIISIGYNGTPSGWDNNCETELVSYDIRDTYYDLSWWFDESTKQYHKLETKPEVIHAESNAITKLAKSNNSSLDASMYITHAPCFECSKLIYQAGIKEVFYATEYRSNDGLKFLEKSGIYVKPLDFIL